MIDDLHPQRPTREGSQSNFRALQRWLEGRVIRADGRADGAPALGGRRGGQVLYLGKDSGDGGEIHSNPTSDGVIEIGGAVYVDESTASVGVGAGVSSPAASLQVVRAGTPLSLHPQTTASFERTDAGQGALLSIIGDANAQLTFGDPANQLVGRFVYDHSVDALRVFVNNAERARIAADGKLGLGTTAPGAELHVYSAAQAPFITLESSHVSGTPVIAQKNSNQEWRWTVRGNIGHEFSVKDQTAGVFPLQIEPGSPTDSIRVQSQGVGLGMAPTAPLTVALPAENLELANARSTGGSTGQGYLTLRVGGNQRTVRLH